MISRITLPARQDWIFAAKTVLASMLALYIGLAAGLPRPYWAMATVFVVAGPLAGATRSKALYRALGTFLGASAAVILVPVLVNSPELLSTAVALWTGTLLFASFFDRSPRSYVLMLAGYSLPLIALPVVNAPETVFDIAVSRSLEITVGIVCAGLVNTIIFPARIGPILSSMIEKWLGDAGKWAGSILHGEAGNDATRERQKLAADIRALDMLISQLGHDSALQSTTRNARELRGRMAMLVPLLASLADRLEGVRKTGDVPQGLQPLTSDVRAWMAGPIHARDATADTLRERIAALEPSGQRGTEWNGLLVSSALERMRELIDLWQDCGDLEEQIRLGDRARRWVPAFRHRGVVGRAQYFDYGLLAFSAGSVVLATLAASWIWILTGWAEGAGCVVMTAVGCSFFAAVDDPAPLIRSFLIWQLVSMVTAGLYLFGILPQVHDFPVLAVVFAVPFFLMAAFGTRPQFTMVAMLMMVNTASLVALSGTYSADFPAFMNGNLASAAGALFALVWSLTTRPFGAALAARRLVRAGWKDIAATAKGSANQDPHHFAGRMLDRLGQLIPRLASGISADVAAADILAELRIGMNILDLQRVRGSVPKVLHGPLDQAIDAVAATFAGRVKSGRAEPPDETVRQKIDDALVEFTQADFGHAAHRCRHAFVGLRRALFPDAAPPLDLGPISAPLAIAAE